jgi:predicted transcriptional regulator
MTASSQDLKEQVTELRARGLRQREIAAELGISQSRVSQLLLGRTGNEAKQPATASSTGNSQEQATGNSQEQATGNSQEQATGNSQEQATGNSTGISQPDLDALVDARYRAEYKPAWDRKADELARVLADRDRWRARAEELQAEVARLERAVAAAPELDADGHLIPDD